MSLHQEFWDAHFENPSGGVIAGKVYNWLNHDNLGELVTDGEVFWIELTWSGATLPKYILNYIKHWASGRGFTYLYDMPMRQF